jgi:hypothetical protein
LTNTIAHLEWIYRNKKYYEWQAAATNLFETYLGLGERVLADNFMEIVKDKYKENENVQLRDLAEDLMNKLVEIWEKGNNNF